MSDKRLYYPLLSCRVYSGPLWKPLWHMNQSVFWDMSITCFFRCSADFPWQLLILHGSCAPCPRHARSIYVLTLQNHYDAPVLCFMKVTLTEVGLQQMTVAMRQGWGNGTQGPLPRQWTISQGWLRNWCRWVWAQWVGEWQCAARARISDLWQANFSGNNSTCRGWYKLI